MEPEVKRELIATAVSALGVPVARAAINSHYRMKAIERQEEMELKVAERRSRGLQVAAGQGGTVAAVGQADPVTFDNPGDVYDELAQLREQTDCQFCHSMIDQLMEASPGEAKQGYEELRTYVRQVDRIKQRGDIEREEAKQIISDMIDTWEVVPRYVVASA